MGFKSKSWVFFLLSFLFWGEISQAQLCRSLFFKREVIKKNITVRDQTRELLIFKPTLKKKNYPVVLYFHGTNAPVEPVRPVNAPYGLYNESAFIQKLTDAGFLVIAPTANRIVPYYIYPAVTAWEANVAPYAQHFEQSRDFALVRQLFDELEGISNLPIDSSNIFVAGFSSGGYMASRLSQEPTWRGRIRGLIIHSASYGTCVSLQCSVPAQLPDWHPPTLLISNKNDDIVPRRTVDLYLQQLLKNNIPVNTIYSNDGGHEWLAQHPELIMKWTELALKK